MQIVSMKYDTDTNGQLCPNQGCLWKLAFPFGEGWYICPHCFCQFWCHETDSDIEDYHCHINPLLYGAPQKPDVIPLARDLGPSDWSVRRGLA